MVRMVSSSAGEGPGGLSSRGFTERRIFRRSMASGTAVSFIGMIGELLSSDRRTTCQVEANSVNRFAPPLWVAERAYIKVSVMDIAPINSQRDYRCVLREIEELMNARRSSPEGDRLDVLVTLVEAWERKH